MNFEFDHVGVLLRVGVDVAGLVWIISSWAERSSFMIVVSDAVDWMIVVIIILYFYT